MTDGNHIIRFYVLEEDYLVGHGITEADALTMADLTVAAEGVGEGVPRVVFAAVATEEGHEVIMGGFSPAVDMP